MINKNIKSEKKRFIPIILVLFLFLAILNVVKIIPYTFAPTAHIIVTFKLSLSIFITYTIMSFQNFKLNFFAMFMPADAPLILAPALVIIKFVSHLAKAVSLNVQLAANITANHLLFSILSNFVFTMFISNGLLSLFSVFPLAIILFISLLKITITLIQAYVFYLLTSIYINDSIHLH